MICFFGQQNRSASIAFFQTILLAKQKEAMTNVLELESWFDKADKLSFNESQYGNTMPRSLKSVLVLPAQILGPFGPPKKRVNFDKFNQGQKCVFCVLTALYVSK